MSQEKVEIVFASKKRRLGSWLIFYMTWPIWSMIPLLPLVATHNLGVLLPKFAGALEVFGITCVIALYCYAAYKLSLNGMTLRHFACGYQVRHKDGRLPNVFTLYAREIVALVTGAFVVTKMMLPALMKRALSSGAGDEGGHVFVRNSSGQVFVSHNNVGAMRDHQMQLEIEAAMHEAMSNLNYEEWFHDKLFSTAPVIASRMNVLRFQSKASSADAVVKPAVSPDAKAS